MKNLFSSLILILAFTSLISAANFVVNNNADTDDANTSDNLCADSSNNCTLRAAIQQANASAGNDTITFSFVNPTVINLTIANDIIVSGNLTITGTGARNLTVNSQVALFSATIRSSGTSIVNINAVTFSNFTSVAGGTGSFYYNNSAATLNLTEVVIRNNTASAGSVLYNLGALNVTRSTFSLNNSNQGGAIGNTGTATIDNSTISNNTSNNGGGGILNFGQLTLNNVTISNNTNNETSGAGFGGGGLANFGGTTNLRNTIVASNTSPTSPDVFNAFNSLGNNLIGKSDGGTGFTNNVNGDKVGTSANPLNPLLGNLQNNGGQTDTRALLPSSPAIDAGNNCVVTAACPSDNPSQPLIADQRGGIFNRLLDSDNNGTIIIDIGAVEAYTPTAASTSISGRVTNTNGQGISNAKVSLTDTNGRIKTVITNSFGYYRLSEITSGYTYILNATAKGKVFAPQVHYLTSEADNLNFIAIN